MFCLDPALAVLAIPVVVGYLVVSGNNVLWGEVAPREHFGRTPHSSTKKDNTTMTTQLMETLSTGDVIEVRTTGEHDGTMTVLVLLAADDFVILDPCDDSTPFVVQLDELVDYRKFDAR